jgi:hypothetical protein
MDASLAPPIVHNLSEMTAKVRRFGPKSALKASKRAKSAGAEHPGLVHPVANAMHQSHGDLAASGVNTLQIKIIMGVTGPSAVTAASGPSAFRSAPPDQPRFSIPCPFRP